MVNTQKGWRWANWPAQHSSVWFASFMAFMESDSHYGWFQLPVSEPSLDTRVPHNTFFLSRPFISAYCSPLTRNSKKERMAVDLLPTQVSVSEACLV
jgi:hypothetical protein